DLVHHVAKPGHGREKALNHRARHARPVRIGGHRITGKHAVHRQLAAMVWNDENAAVARYILQAECLHAEILFVQIADDGKTDLGRIGIETPGIEAELADVDRHAIEHVRDLGCDDAFPEVIPEFHDSDPATPPAVQCRLFALCP